MDPQPVAGALDARDRCAGFDGDPELVERGHEPADHVRIEKGQEPRGALEDGDLRPRAGGQVRELRRDIAAADEHDPAREALELQKIVARAHQRLAGNMERDRVGAGGDEGMAGLQGAVANRDPVRRDEAGDAVESVRAELGIAPFLPSRDRIGERPLERDQVRPIDRQSPLDAMPDHARGRIGRLLAAHQHLLRVAAAKRAGSAEWAMIDDRDGPPGGADPADGDLGGRAAADDDQVVWRLPGHGVLLATAGVVLAGLDRRTGYIAV